MEDVVSSKGKNLKFNNGACIDLDVIPLNERQQALKEFADGSVALEKCLRVMWESGLKTLACSKGEKGEYESAYIAMTEGIDVFSFLSEDLRSNENITLMLSGDCQVIRIYGFPEIRESLLEKIAYDISTGKKQNFEIRESNFVGVKYEQLLNESKYFSGMSDDEIKQRGIELNRILDNGTQEEIDEIMPEFYELVGLINQKIVDRNTRRK